MALPRGFGRPLTGHRGPVTHLVEPRHHVSMDDYESVAHLGVAVGDLRREARNLLPVLAGRRVWMVSSTARGGGVAELLPPTLSLMGELGVDARWLVMESDDPEFFRLTKRIHNLVHGRGDPDLGAAERRRYEQVSQRAADSVAEHVSAGDVLVVHDPQPLALGAYLRRRMEITAIWRCHIGIEADNAQTRAAWEFLREYAEPYDHAIFTAPEYIPGYLSGRTAIIHPGIDPLSHKNRELQIHKLVGVLANGGLIEPTGPVLTPPFPEPARRLQRDGGWAPATQPADLGLLFRPTVTQVSRWDHLKGYLPLLRGFVTLIQQLSGGGELPQRYRRTLETARLVLAGPDPAAVDDDPEGQEVLAAIQEAYLGLPPELQEAVAVISLPMDSQKNNALLVNALQRCSDIVVQNSLHEGFGLTATEAMWKHVAVLGTRAAGLRQQIRPGLDGVLVDDPEDEQEIAHRLGELLADPALRDSLGRTAQRRVHDDFLVLTQVRRWLEVISETVATATAPRPAG